MKILNNKDGQMTVELAVLIPVVVVVALIAINLMEFIDACAAFDVLSSDTVISQAVSPSQGVDTGALCAQLEGDIASGLQRESSCSVSVRCEDQGLAEGSLTNCLLPHYVKYVCTLKFKPWPRNLNLPIVSYSAPLGLSHEKSIVVDMFKSGVVI